MKYYKIITREEADKLNSTELDTVILCAQHFLFKEALNDGEKYFIAWRGNVLYWTDEEGARPSNGIPLSTDDKVDDTYSVVDNPWFKRCADAVKELRMLRSVVSGIEEEIRRLK